MKKEILGAKKLFEATAQVPSPSKDFTQIIITEKGMVWRRWKISLRSVTQGAVPQPSEEVMLHEDFRYDTSLQVCTRFLSIISLGQLVVHVVVNIGLPYSETLPKVGVLFPDFEVWLSNFLHETWSMPQTHIGCK